MGLQLLESLEAASAETCEPLARPRKTPFKVQEFQAVEALDGPSKLRTYSYSCGGHQ